MRIEDLIKREIPPVAWAEGDNIPWHEPGFSERMLKYHLSQASDAASRRFEKIDKQVKWVHTSMLQELPSKILDLGCGPGLYSHRLGALGHDCTGIDYSPASIEYAREGASNLGTSCDFRLEDIRQAEYGDSFALAMLIYGEFNIFKPSDAALILGKMHAALDDGGLLLLEVSTLDSVRKMGEAEASWYTSETELFLARPHICLQENFWDAGSRTTTIRYFTVDSGSEAARFAQTFQGYGEDDYRAMIAGAGFDDITFHESFQEEDFEEKSGFIAITARKAR